jgi:DNA repair ATPase RecN
VNVEEAKNDLKDAKAELNAEYPTFKSDAEIRIAENETRIAELRAILNKPGKLPLDPLRKKEIDDLEERNAQLKNRLYGYENERTDWINFKNEFNRDMDEMGEAFKNLGKKNLK